MACICIRCPRSLSYAGFQKEPEIGLLTKACYLQEKIIANVVRKIIALYNVSSKHLISAVSSEIIVRHSQDF